MKIYTFGCKVNQVESDKIKKNLSLYDTSKLIIINSCTVTARADSKCRQLVSKLKKQYNNYTIVLTGCYVKRDLGKLKNLYPDIIIINNESKFKISEILPLTKYSIKPLVSSTNSKPNRTRAFLKIQDGCDSFCSYCIIPYVRNKIWSKPFEHIKKETHTFIEQGYKEIVLTGIRTGCYKYIDKNKTKWNLSRLINWLNKFDEIKRIRISSIEPTDITNELIKTIKKTKVCPHLHISIQSGDNKTLKAMNRNYTTESLKKIFTKLRTEIPGLLITTDIIVGFPGETQNSFKNTCKTIKDLKINGLHIFPFSPRPGTKAFDLKNKNSAVDMQNRKKMLQELDLKIRKNTLKKSIGSISDVLIENKNSKGYVQGMTPDYLKVKIPCKNGHNFNNIINTIIKVKLVKINEKWPVTFEGKII